jgi:hypothetical protein
MLRRTEPAASRIAARHSAGHERRAPLGACAALLIALLAAGAATAQSVVLHLRNGDRVAGVVLFENTNEVAISNAWVPRLLVPVAQIDKREALIPPSAAGNAGETQGKLGGQFVGHTAAPPSSKTNNPAAKRWKGEVSAGSTIIAGDTHSQIYFAHSSVTYARPYDSDPREYFRNTFSFNWQYGKAEGVVSANRLDAGTKTTADLSHEFYAYNLGRVGYDEIQRINLQGEEGAGGGYRFLTNANFVVNLELGGSYQWQDRSADETTRDFFFRLGEDATWSINSHLKLMERAEFDPRSDNVRQYRTRVESTLSYLLLANLTLDLSLLDLYDTEPAVGAAHTEFEVRSGVGFKF